MISSLLRRSALAWVVCVASGAGGVAQSPRPDSGALPPPPPTDPQLVVAQDAALDPKLPTVFVVGDSTARNGRDLGWGDHLAHYFDTTRINVANRSRAGRSSRSYMVEGLWDKTLAEMKPGDYVMLQWGHNDGGDLGGAKPRGSLRGLGEETQDVPQTTGAMAGRTETVHTYGWYNRKYIADTRAKGATPMMLSLTEQNIWKPDAGGVPQLAHGMAGYDEQERQIAAAAGIQYVDMGAVEWDRLSKAGPEETAKLFPIDHTHTSAEGAELNAQSVVIALKRANSPLVKYLNERGRGLRQD
ncbi:MAG: GDSL-type esterase/lipase family protein [Acidobacteriota bacterium]|nr:GDSL-type esterase/lipase family protein [Acidobacteriota bacterium]